MKEKEQIVANWLPRYTGVPLDGFGEHVLVTNFGGYLGHFARLTGAEVVGMDRPMPSATADGITMINFGMGSPNAATLMDLLSAIGPKAVLFLGKCGGLKKKNQLGDLVLPIAAIRGDGTSNDYMPAEVPALPAFALQRAVSTMIRDLGHDYWTGTVYTTNRRVWEHDAAFKDYLRRLRCMAIDMETATVFAAAGGARVTTSVDLSRTYLDWARRNLERNGFGDAARHRLLQEDVLAWLETPARERYDVIFLDPPTLSRSKRMAQELDVQRDHVALIRAALLKLAPNGLLIFSTNFRKFRLDTEGLAGLAVADVTPATIPKDFARNPRIHQCFEIRVPKDAPKIARPLLTVRRKPR